MTLPPLDHRAYYQTRRGKVRTVPTSRESSSKLSRLEPTPSKRSWSANNKQIHQTAIQNLDNIGTRELLERLDASQGKRSKPDSQDPDSKHKNIGRGRLTKVETVQVLRARSGLMAPFPTPPLAMTGIMPGSSHQPVPSHLQPLLLKSEERRTEDKKKKRRQQ